MPSQPAFQLSLTLERWVDMPSLGWIAVDNHVHTDAELEDLGAWLAAGGIALGTMLSWHNGPDP